MVPSACDLVAVAVPGARHRRHRATRLAVERPLSAAAGPARLLPMPGPSAPGPEPAADPMNPRSFRPPGIRARPWDSGWSIPWGAAAGVRAASALAAPTVPVVLSPA